MANEIKDKFDTSGVHPWVKYGLAILLIIVAIDNLLSGSYLLAIIPIAISWFYSGPQCVKWAQEGRHNQTWAFFIGVVFNLVGVLLYWLFIKRLHYPIIGGIVAILLSVVALILITIIQLPIIYPALESSSQSGGIVFSLIFFSIVFIVGAIIAYYYK